MPYYRVSLRDDYLVGSPILEGKLEEGNARSNIAIFSFLIKFRKEKEIFTLLENPKNKHAGIPTAYKEAFLEKIRLTDFQVLPKRFDNMMVFGSLKDAKNFNTKHRKNGGYIYGVDIADSKYFLADMNILDDIKSYSFVDMEGMARRYWSGEMTGLPIKEYVLFPSSEVIVKAKLS